MAKKAPANGQGLMNELARRSDLSGVVLHHQQFVDLEGDPFALALAHHLGGQLALLELEVRGDVGQTWEFQVGFGQLLAGLLLADGDHITGFALVAGDVDDAAIHGHVAMVHQLTGTGDGGSEAETEANVVEAVFQQLEKVGSR